MAGEGKKIPLVVELHNNDVVFLSVPRQAAILQQTADYIFALEQEKTQLLAQNNQLKRFLQVTARRHKDTK